MNININSSQKKKTSIYGYHFCFRVENLLNLEFSNFFSSFLQFLSYIFYFFNQQASPISLAKYTHKSRAKTERTEIVVYENYSQLKEVKF